MTSKTLVLLVTLGAWTAAAQPSDIVVKLMGGQRPVMAVSDFRGSGETQRLMDAFNQTLFADLEQSGVFTMAAKSMYPLEVPQHPRDFRAPIASSARPRKGEPPPRPVRQGPWLTDWSGPPVNAQWLAFGYAAPQDGRLVAFGWLFNVTQTDVANAQVLGKLYFGSLDEAGARKAAHDFANDILAQFGAKGLAGTKIIYVSSRERGVKEIWQMEFDGSNQKQLTAYKSISTMPAVSPDGTRFAFTTYARGNPSIMIHSLETGRRLPFYNQAASMNATAEFTPDGQRLLFSSSLSGFAQIYMANLDGSNLRRLTESRAIEVEPRVNPKNPSEMVFVSGRAGPPQIYKMNIDGVDVVRLTQGEGEAVNPAWHPDGRHIAFAWSRGYEPGNFNIFVMDVATQEFVQLTHGAGRNENPSWAPDGRHLVFSSNRSGRNQIWTMLADGTQLKQLTTQGENEKPVWSR